jgi:hypothetical protein
MDAICCHAGLGAVISSMYVMADELVGEVSVLDELPALMIFPGKYIAALPPSRVRESTVLHDMAAGS